VKKRLNKILPLALASLSGWACPVHAQTKSPPAAGAYASVFTLPAGPRDGRDPFFPESTRTFETKVVASNVFELSSLKFMGLSGTPGHLFAIINNRTFTTGDENDVVTASGRIHVRCLEVTTASVLLEINGQLHRIKLQAR